MADDSETPIPTIAVEGAETQSEDSAASTASVPAGRRRREKVPLAPGHTLAHWNALVMSRQRSYPSSKITPKELAKHRSQDDAWVSLNGKVFDITKYLDYHPGGTYRKSLDIIVSSHSKVRKLTFRAIFQKQAFQS